jgi:multiple sugar transport system substrate-binding protein
MKYMTLPATAVAVILGHSAAFADCGIASGNVNILSNDFDALGIVINEARSCAGDGVTVTANMTTEHRALAQPALTTNPAQYTVTMVANNSIAPLLARDLVRPLDDLVAAHGSQLLEQQLVRVDGQIVAIAFMVNGQNLFMRGDILEQAGLEQPTSIEEMLAAAEKIRADGIMRYPLAAANQSGWYLANEFVNTYMGLGGQFFEPGSAVPAVNGEVGVQTLELMKAMTEYMAPEFLTHTSDELRALYLGGQVAMMNQWASMVNGHIDPAGPAPEIGEATILAAAPTAGGGTVPAAALWWDGFAIAANISDEDAEASFLAMMHGIRPEMAQENPTAAAWLVADFTPPETAQAILTNAQMGAQAYPMAPYMGLLHTALGAELGDFMQGRESAEDALRDVVDAYTTAAREAGFLN